jgi:RNA polymerase sigma-70 factor (ECF subfamily)
MQDSDALVTRAKAGDNEAFEELVAPCREKILAWISGQMGPRLRGKGEAEDLLQDTFVWALRSIEKLEWRGRDLFEQWLFSIAKHVVLKEARHDRRHALVLESEPQGHGPSPSRALRRDERFDRLQKALDSLGPDQRHVVELARIKGVPIKEIAIRMKRSPDAISQLLLRALKKLRDTVNDTESLSLPDRELDFRKGVPDEKP